MIYVNLPTTFGDKELPRTSVHLCGCNGTQSLMHNRVEQNKPSVSYFVKPLEKKCISTIIPLS